MAIQEGVALKKIMIWALKKEVTHTDGPRLTRKVRHALEEIHNISNGVQWNGPPEISFGEEDDTTASSRPRLKF